jgi:hypothetical protein
MVRVLVPSGALGLNYDQEALRRGIDAKPDIIAIDGGSTDSGPYYLGRGVSKYARASIKREWSGLMQARAEADVPLVIGTAGTCGADTAVDWMLDITREIAAEQGTSLKIAVLRSGQDPAEIVEAHAQGRITPLGNAPGIDAEIITSCSNIVALAGAEQIAAALETGAEIVIAGRTTDTAIIAALPLMRGCHAGAAWHGAKIGECGALCATNPQSGVILIDFDATGFTVTPLADGARASPHTVSAHMLYENVDPFILYEPGGHLDVTGASYTALDDTSVRVDGSVWVPSTDYTVKLEGARPAGYRTVALALLRDPHYVANAARWADDITRHCSAKVRDRMGLSADDFTLELRLIGQTASFGALETAPPTAHEVGVLGIITAPSEAAAAEIGKMLNPYLLHHPLTSEEEQPTFAFLFSPPEMHHGQVYEFALNHVLHLDDPMEAFRLEVIEHG